MPLPKKADYTIDDIFDLPENVRAELINGQIYYMAPPSRKHQQILGELYYCIRNHISSHNGDCDVYMAPFAVFLNNENTKYVEPDLSIICDQNKLDDKGCHGAPDWIIEIVSQGSRRMDYYIKLAAYQEAGVRLYWIVDIEKKSVVVYDLEFERIPAIYSFSDEVPVTIYQNLSINFSLFKD